MNTSEKNEVLKKSPLFNASLASKELFHSNFLAWVFETYPEETVLFFKDRFQPFPIERQVSVEREKRHIDLTINFNDGYKILIENKVKSLPGQAQLDRYCESTKEEKEILILLSLYPFDYPNFLSYRSIIEWLNQINIKPSSFEEEETQKRYYIIKDYIDFTTELVSITESLGKDDTIFNFHSASEDYKKYGELRLQDIFHKIKYKNFRTKVVESVHKMGNSEAEMSVFRGTDYFSRGTAAANFTIHLQNEKDDQIYLEIQLQDNMLRYMLRSNKCENKAEEIMDHQFFRSYFGHVNNFNDKIFNNKIKKRKDYNKYGDYIIYKYLKVNKNAPMEEIIETLAVQINETITNVSTHKNEMIKYLKELR